MWAPGIILYLTLITLVNSYVFPLNYEITYKYEGIIKATTDKPILFTSDYQISATINAIRFRNDTIMSINDIKYTVYSGKHDEVLEKSKILPIPKEAESLNLPFAVRLGRNGKLSGIFTDDKDEAWSINMKQAIASLFQLDLSQLDFEKTLPYAFYTKEPTVYGNCDVFYDIVSTNGTRQSMIKTQNPLTCQELQLRSSFNLDTTRCTTEFEKPLTMHSERLYDVEKNGNTVLINTIKAYGSVNFSPFNGKSNVHSIATDQTLELLKIKKSSEDKYKLDKMHYQKIKPQYTTMDVITGGRHRIDAELSWKKILISLRNIVEYLKTSHVTLSENSKEQKGDFYNLIQLTRYIDEETLYSSYLKLNDEKDLLDVFIEILPFIGTYASSSLIKNITINNSLDEYRTMKLLKNMPFHLVYPDKILLNDLSILIKDDMQLSKNVAETAIITFASIISKVAMYYPQDTEINTHVQYYIVKFNNAKEHDEKFLYINALKNIHTHKVTEFLINIIQNTEINSHIRCLAIWAIDNQRSNDKTNLLRIYRSLVTDSIEDIEVRAAALNVLMYASSDMLNIYRYIKTVDRDELYRLYYTTLENIGESKVPCRKPIAEQAKQILRYARKPTLDDHYNTNRVFDYFDSTYGFGASVRTTVIHSVNNFTSLYVQLAPQIGEFQLNQKAFYIRVENLDVTKLMQKKISQIIMLLNNENIGFEFITMQNNHVTSAIYCKPGNCKNVISALYKQHMTDTKDKLSYSIEQVIEGELVIPTEIGVPSVFFIQMPMMQKIESLTNLSFTDDGSMNLVIKHDAIQWNHQVCGLSVFNPIADVWHGSKKHHLVNSHVPIDFTLNVNPLQGNITFVMNDVYTKKSGFQSFVYNQMYISDDDDKNIQAACPECQLTNLVTNGEDFRKKHIIWQSTSKYLGIGLDVVIFDCENQISKSQIISLKNEFMNKYNKIPGKNNISKLFMALRHMWAFVTISPMPGMCGFGLSIKQNHLIPNAQADLTITNTFKQDDDLNTLSSFFKWNLISTYNIKQHNEIMKSWKANLALNVNNNQSNILINFKQINFDNTDKSICIAGKETLNDKQIDTQWRFYENNNPNDNCNYNNSITEIGIQGLLSDDMCPIHFEYNITHKNDKEYRNFWIDILDSLRNTYADYFVRYHKFNTNVIDDNMKIVIDNPVDRDEVDVNILTANDNYGYEGISYDNFYWTGFILPYVTKYKHIYSMFSMMDYCEVGLDYLMDIEGNRIHYDTSENWIKFADSCNNTCDWEIFVKQYREKQMMIRIIIKGELFEINYENGINMKFNNKIESHDAVGFYSNSWFKYKIYHNGQGIYLHADNYNLSLNFFNNVLKIQMPTNESSGKCYH